MPLDADSIYLDVNADRAVHPAAWRAYLKASGFFGNPSSSHRAGREARAQLEEARKGVADGLGVTPAEIIFTSGGTEADALAVIGAVRAYRGEGKPHVVCSGIEHAAVFQTAHSLHQRGEIELDVVPMGRSGVVSGERVLELLKPQTALVSVIMASNETGVIQPIKELGQLLGDHSCLFHTDAVQALGQIPVKPRDLGVDLVSVSAHKVGGVSGVGALFIGEGSQVRPLIVGGGQELGLRSGTPNIAGVAAFAAALGEVKSSSSGVRDEFEEALCGALSPLEIVGRGQPRLPNTSSVRFLGCEADGIMMALDIEGVAVSTGSACSTGSILPSRILLAMGFDEVEAKECLRFSFPAKLSQEILTRASDAVIRLVRQIRASM